MKISEFARQAGVTIKAVRYYEQLGLLAPSRMGNGYREYTEEQVHIAREIRALATVGIPPAQAGPAEDLRRGAGASRAQPGLSLRSLRRPRDAARCARLRHRHSS